MPTAAIERSENNRIPAVDAYLTDAYRDLRRDVGIVKDLVDLLWIVSVHFNAPHRR
ncbi:MAG: hypothetical protein ABSE86_00975 [Bryobacteraceae bacterium]